MAKVTGLGGLFFKSDDVAATRAWYAQHLGLEFSEWGGWAFQWRDIDNPEQIGRTEWSPFEAESDYMAPSDKSFMMNFRVDDLDALLSQLRAAGIEMIGTPETCEYGKFAWIMDPNGIKLELWEPPAAASTS